MSTKTSREIALERRKAMSDGGKKAALHSSSTKDRVRSSQDIHSTGATSSNKVLTPPSKSNIPANKIARKSTSSKLSSKELGIERRKAMSSHGKSAINSSDRTRTDVKSDIKVTLTEKTQTLEDHNLSLIHI